MPALALPPPRSHSAIAKIESSLRGLENKARKALAAKSEFSETLVHDFEEGLVALAAGVYYGKTGGYRKFGVDAALAVGVVLGGVGLFSDHEYSKHAHSVGKQLVNSYITLKGFSLGKAWAATDTTTPSTTQTPAASGNEHARGAAGQTFTPASAARAAQYLM